MSKKQSWGNSFNGNFNQELNYNVDNIKRSLSITNQQDLNEFNINIILLRELCGTYKFETDHASLLAQENKFWFNLYFYGIVGLWYFNEEDKFVVARVTNIKRNMFNEVTSVDLYPANTSYLFAPDTVDDNYKKFTLTDKKLNNVFIVLLDITAEPFLIRYGWMAKTFKEIYDSYMSSLDLRNKGFFLWKNSNNDQLWTDFETSLKDKSKPYIVFTAPEIATTNDNESANSLLEKPFKMEQFNKNADELIGMDELIKYWKFAKDLLGMNANTSQKKERVISSELDEADVNTILMSECEMRNFNVLSKELKERVNISLTIKKTKEEEMPEKDISGHLENESIIDEGEDHE